MKKAFFFSAAFAAAFAAASFAGNTVSANTDTQDSTATFTVEGGENNGNLLLTAVPDFDFGTVSLPDIISGGLKADSKADGKTQLSVLDLTGSSAGWNVTATATPFTNNGNTLNGATIALTGTGNAALTAGGTLTLDGSTTADVLKTTDVAKGQGTTTQTVSGALTLGAQPAAINGKYTSTITWTLTNGLDTETNQPADSNTAADSNPA